MRGSSGNRRHVEEEAERRGSSRYRRHAEEEAERRGNSRKMKHAEEEAKRRSSTFLGSITIIRIVVLFITADTGMGWTQCNVK